MHAAALHRTPGVFLSLGSLQCPPCKAACMQAAASVLLVLSLLMHGLGAPPGAAVLWRSERGSAAKIVGCRSLAHPIP